MNGRGNAGNAGMVILFVVAVGLFFLAKGFLGKLEFPLVPSAPVGEAGGETTGGAVSTPLGGTSAPGPAAPSAPAVIPPAERAGAVVITSVSVGNENTPSRVVIQAQVGDGESVNITGWKIQTNKRQFLIPQAVNSYYVFGPNAESDLMLSRGETVTIFVGARSPVGQNFRLNKCTGYLNDREKFSFALPNECPVPEAVSYQHLAGWCQDYIRGFGRCKLPDPLVTNEWRGDAGNACRSFVNGFFNVDSCYRNFQGDNDFLRGEWYAWADFLDIFDSRHDWVRLMNPAGKTIDDYTY